MEVAKRRPFPASSAAENGSEIANFNSFYVRLPIIKLIYPPSPGRNPGQSRHCYH